MNHPPVPLGVTPPIDEVEVRAPFEVRDVISTLLLLRLSSDPPSSRSKARNAFEALRLELIVIVTPNVPA
jgi:hypothetical protein